MDFNNIIAIHLNKFKTVEDFQRLIDDNNLNETVDAQKMIEHKEMGFTKMFFDATTKEGIAFVHKSDKKITFQPEFLDHLKNMKSIDFKKVSSFDLSIDSILDKINERGIESLSKKEKEFLENNYL